MRIGPVGVLVLLLWRPASSFASPTMLSLLGSEASVVRVLLHDESDMGESLCLNASPRPAHQDAAVSGAGATASSAAGIKM
jgi:hypothetical protein